MDTLVTNKRLIRTSKDLDTANIIYDSKWKVLRNLNGNLIREEPNGQLMGYIAKKWWFENDNKTLVFELDPNWKFSDGSKLVPNDVAITIKRLLLFKPPPHFIDRKYFKGVSELKKLNSDFDGIKIADNKIALNFTISALNFLNYFTTPDIGILKAVMINQKDLSIKSWNVTSGAYSVLEEDDSSITLVQNKYYKFHKKNGFKYIKVIDSSKVEVNEIFGYYTIISTPFKDLTFLDHPRFKLYIKKPIFTKLAIPNYNHSEFNSAEKRKNYHIFFRKLMDSMIPNEAYQIADQFYPPLSDLHVNNEIIGNSNEGLFPSNVIINLSSTGEEDLYSKLVYKKIRETSPSARIRLEHKDRDYKCLFEKDYNGDLDIEGISFNDKDPMSSYQFFIIQVLRPYHDIPEIKHLVKLYRNAEETTDMNKRRKILQEISRYALDNYLFFPITYQAPMFLLRNDIEILDFNQYDYEMIYENFVKK